MNFQDAYTEVFLKAAGHNTDKETVKKFKKVWWYNLRTKNHGGLRLTELGLRFIEDQAHIKIYKIELERNISMTPQVLIWLDQFIDCPFYIDQKYIMVLKERAAFEIYLFRGDVKKMGYAKAMHKRLNQEFQS